jgi:DNA-binding HxlR family transcriptional regulator
MTELAQDFHPALVTRSLSAGMNMFAGKWKLSILWYLEQRPRRFSELASLLPGVTAKVLTYQLRDLEDAGLISRTESVGPRQTQYALTESGLAAMPLLQLVCEWGNWQLRRCAVEDHCETDETSSSRL